MQAGGSCRQRLRLSSIWEDACIEGLIDSESIAERITLSAAGKAFLSA